jgi:hypothetical protein
MDVWLKTRELLGNIANVTESGSKIARYKIEVADLDRKLGQAFRKAGERVYRLQEEGQGDIAGDADVRAAFAEVRRLRHRMEAIHREVERHTAKAGAEIGKATKMVKDEAGKTAGAVKRETERAVAIIKEETGRAASAIKQAVTDKTGRGKKGPTARKPAGTDEP